MGGPAQLLIETRRTLKFYTVPPERDWATLFTWCLAPPGALAIAWEVIRTIRRQMRPISDNVEPSQQQTATS